MKGPTDPSPRRFPSHPHPPEGLYRRVGLRSQERRPFSYFRGLSHLDRVGARCVYRSHSDFTPRCKSGVSCGTTPEPRSPYLGGLRRGTLVVTVAPGRVSWALVHRQGTVSARSKEDEKGVSPVSRLTVECKSRPRPRPDGVPGAGETGGRDTVRLSSRTLYPKWVSTPQTSSDPTVDSRVASRVCLPERVTGFGVSSPYPWGPLLSFLFEVYPTFLSRGTVDETNDFCDQGHRRLASLSPTDRSVPVARGRLGGDEGRDHRRSFVALSLSV